MPELIIELPPQAEQTEFNLRRWAEVCADRALAKLEGRVETDRYGRVVVTPTPAPFHVCFQAQIGYLLRTHVRAGEIFMICPISTADGVRAVDVAWASPQRFAELGEALCFQRRRRFAWRFFRRTIRKLKSRKRPRFVLTPARKRYGFARGRDR